MVKMFKMLVLYHLQEGMSIGRIGIKVNYKPEALYG